MSDVALAAAAAPPPPGIPTLASLGIATADVSTACGVLEALSGAGAPGMALFNAAGRPPLRRLRKAVAPFLEEMRRR
jgi:hypothetical protein